MSEFNRQVLEGYPEQFEKAKEHFVNPNFGPSLETLEKQCEGDENLQALLQDVLNSCYPYVEQVFQFDMMNAKGILGEEEAEEFRRLDKNRGLMHNAVITNINIFSKALAKAKENGNQQADNEWMRSIASGGRAAYMKFAVFIALSEYLRYKEEKSKEQGGIQ